MVTNTIFIDNNPEQILQEIIESYESKTGQSLGLANVERVLLDVLSYRESLIRAAIEVAMRGNFVALASGEALDYWGDFYGIDRLDGESDDVYRVRIKSNVNNVAIGTRQAIIDRVKALKEVSDVVIRTKHDDITIAPGVVEVYSIIVDGAIRRGRVANDSEKTLIVNHFSDKSFGLVGEWYRIKNPTRILINGTIDIQLVSSYTDT